MKNIIITRVKLEIDLIFLIDTNSEIRKPGETTFNYSGFIYTLSIVCPVLNVGYIYVFPFPVSRHFESKM